MSSLRNKFKQVAQEQVAQQCTGTTGVLVGYNNKMNTATIKFKNPNGIGYLYRENVPVSCNLGGISSSSPICGQRCIIMFTNGNILTPVVTGIADREYSENIFSRKISSSIGIILSTDSSNNLSLPSLSTKYTFASHITFHLHKTLSFQLHLQYNEVVAYFLPPQQKHHIYLNYKPIWQYAT